MLQTGCYDGLGCRFTCSKVSPKVAQDDIVSTQFTSIKFYRKPVPRHIQVYVYGTLLDGHIKGFWVLNEYYIYVCKKSNFFCNFVFFKHYETIQTAIIMHNCKPNLLFIHRFTKLHL